MTVPPVPPTLPAGVLFPVRRPAPALWLRWSLWPLLVVLVVVMVLMVAGI